MDRSDALLKRVWELVVAAALLTRLPLPTAPDTTYERQSNAVWAFPPVGAILGGFAVLISLGLGLPAGLSAFVILALVIIATGAMHEDGLADCTDGFWGGWDRTRRLDIMKDSQIGTYGVLALIFSIGSRWTALSSLADQLWVYPIVAMLSRAMMPVLMYALPHARQSGLSHGVGRPSNGTVAAGLVLSAAFTLLVCGTLGLALLVAAIVTTAFVGLVARRKIGGQTGDVLGATQQLNEIVLLCICVVLI